MAVCAVGALSAAWACTAKALDYRELAVIVNTWDPLSVQIGEYYAARRHINFQNYIKVGFRPGQKTMTSEDFVKLQSWVAEQTRPNVQAYALTWALPYRVGCMSITTAFAMGYSPDFCEPGCKPTRSSPYFKSAAREPFTRFGIRPTMSIAAYTFDQAKELIDRGVESDGSRPQGTAYLLSTTDSARNVRSASYPEVEKALRGKLAISVLRKNVLLDAKDVLFYFTGLSRVDGLGTLRFLPGAVADHLTSFGGEMTDDSGQMSALRWLEAGATGSYGTVSEPCAFPGKFPDVPVLLSAYLKGETLIEAYWKSVAMPGQGIFIGEPLAAPFSASAVQ